MFDYKTIEEKAEEWNLSPRYIQTLCRQREIEGAVKRAGSWFIPDSVDRQSIKQKTHGQYLMFSGTKKKIFEASAELFAKRSYVVVSIKDIASEVGVRQSAVYNHFESKQQILDTIYKFYCHYLFEDRPTLEEQESVLRDGDLFDIINCVFYAFDDKYYNLMIFAKQIIMQRAFIDEQAGEIYKVYAFDAGIKYAETVFSRAVEIGRLAPFDTHSLAVFCYMNSFFLYTRMLLHPGNDYHWQLGQEQDQLNQYALKFLTDLKVGEPTACPDNTIR
jgi:AcrR family transcriptional regulator